MAPAAQAADLTYSCTVLGNPVALQSTITTDLPETAEVGESIPVQIDATVTVPWEVYELAYGLLDARSVEGSVDANIAYDGDGQAADLAVPNTPLEEGQPVVLQASGPQSAPFVATEAGTVDVHAGDFTADLTFLNEAGGEAIRLDIPCEAPEDALVQTVEVTASDDEDEATPTTTTVTVTPERINYGEDVRIDASVTADEGQDVPEGDLVLTFAGEEYPAQAVDGAADWEPLIDIPAGAYDIAVDFVPADAEAFAPSSATATLVVFAETATTLELTETEFVEGADVDAVATVVTVPEEAGDPEGIVEFTIEGFETLDAPTASPAELSLSDIPAGEYTIVATFLETDAFGESVSEEISFTVLAATSPVSGGGAGTGTMPPTGAAASMSLLGAALLLIGGGIGAVFLSRRQAGVFDA